MTGRVQLGWRIPRDTWENFVEHVTEKWGQEGAYVRFELESAMREYLDQDGQLVELEGLVKSMLDARGLSSSTTGTTYRARHDNTRKVNYRINAELKEEFAIFVDSNVDESYGAILGRALSEYTDGGRAQRLVDDVQKLINGGPSTGTTGESDENTAETSLSTGSQSGTTPGTDENVRASSLSSGSQAGTTGGSDENPAEVTTDPRIVMEIANDLPETCPQRVIDGKIAKAADGSAQTIEAYREAAVKQAALVEHPHREEFYISESLREEWTLWCDLNKELRIARLRRLMVKHALENNNLRDAADYKTVQTLFKENLSAGPSHDYAYTLMRGAADAPGFNFKKIRGNYRLQVNLDNVKGEVIQDVLDKNEQLSKKGVMMNTNLQSFIPPKAPSNSPAAADDD